MSTPSISIYLDTRRKKDDGNYPVKLRVYFNYETRFYPIGIDLSEEDFKRSYCAQKPREEYKKLKRHIQGHEVRANQIRDKIEHFSFDRFEKKFLRPINSEYDVFFYYGKAIEDFKRRERVNTASNYELSAKSIKRFLESKGKKESNLQFDEIKVSFLEDYQDWMLQNGKSITTVGIYLRPLQAIFNHAIADTESLKEIYPFGKRKYQIPAGKNTKKSLTGEELRRLMDYDVAGREKLQEARDFWFFSYASNGMNMRDIAELKYSDLRADSFSFIRTKTKYTIKGELKPITVGLNQFSRSVIQKYANKDKKPDNYVFPIFRKRMNEEEKVRAIENFTRFVNQHMKIIAKAVGVTEKISTYWARHTFTSFSIINNGKSLEFIQQSLGHSSSKMTQVYLSSFPESAIKDNAEQLMNF